MSKRRCLNCHHTLHAQKNPKQRYCSKRICQNVRRRKWRRKKLHQDPDYRENQRQANKRWRAKNPQYWREYRAKHLRYSDRNRQQQRSKRKLMRQFRHLAVSNGKFAKSDAFEEKNNVISRWREIY